MITAKDAFKLTVDGRNETTDEIERLVAEWIKTDVEPAIRAAAANGLTFTSIPRILIDEVERCSDEFLLRARQCATLAEAGYIIITYDGNSCEPVEISWDPETEGMGWRLGR